MIASAVDPQYTRLFWIGGLAAAVSWISVGALRGYAVSRGVLDTPQGRSSHVVPTPRGGGAGLVLAAIVGFVVASPAGVRDWTIVLALVGVIPTAIAGWMDDHRSLPVLPRLGAHALSATLLLPLALQGSGSLSLAALTGVAWLVAAISAVNVVNFMDGIDGIIGLQTLVFGTHVALLAMPGTPASILGIMLGAAAVGFLLWNWSPARIFLGDVGSGTVALLALIAAILLWREGRWSFLAVSLPLLPLFLDATVAIIRRARRGESLTTAHRSHLYQRLANEAGWGHARVTLLYGAVATTATVLLLLVSPQNWIPAVVGYAMAVGALGWMLDRRAQAMWDEVALAKASKAVSDVQRSTSER